VLVRPSECACVVGRCRPSQCATLRTGLGLSRAGSWVLSYVTRLSSYGACGACELVQCRSAGLHCPASCPALHCRAGSSPAANRHCSGSGGLGAPPGQTPACRRCTAPHPTLAPHCPAPTQRPRPAAPHCTAAAEQPPTPTSATPRQPGPGSLVGRQCIALRPSEALQVLHALRLSVSFCAHEIGSFAFRMRAQPRTCMLRAPI
jgi:hypothetical protein